MKKSEYLASGAVALVLATAATAQGAVTYIGDAIITGSGTDLSGLAATILEDGVSPENGLNGFGSGLTYAGGNLFSRWLTAVRTRWPTRVAPPSIIRRAIPIDTSSSRLRSHPLDRPTQMGTTRRTRSPRPTLALRCSRTRKPCSTWALALLLARIHRSRTTVWTAKPFG